MKKAIFLSGATILAVAAVVAGATTAFFNDTETSTGNTFTAGAIDLQIDNTSYYNGEWNEGTSWTLKDLTNELFFNFDDLKPGDWGEDTISLHVENNDAWVCADVTLTSNDDNGLTEPEAEDGDNTPGDANGFGEGELAQNVHFMWWADDGDNVYETCLDEEAVQQGCVEEQTLPGGPLGALQVGETASVTLADSNFNIWGDSENKPLPGGSVRYVAKAWCFGDFQLNPEPQDGEGYTGTDINPAGTNGPDKRKAGVNCNGAPVNNMTQTDSMTADISFMAVQSRNNPNFSCQQRG